MNAELLAEVLALAKGRTVECSCLPGQSYFEGKHQSCPQCGGSFHRPNPAFAGLVTVLEWEQLTVGDDGQEWPTADWSDLPTRALRGALEHVIAQISLSFEDAVANNMPGGETDPDDAILIGVKKALEGVPQ